jgi:hypothetical protein
VRIPAWQQEINRLPAWKTSNTSSLHQPGWLPDDVAVLLAVSEYETL